MHVFFLIPCHKSNFDRAVNKIKKASLCRTMQYDDRNIIVIRNSDTQSNFAYTSLRRLNFHLTLPIILRLSLQVLAKITKPCHYFQNSLSILPLPTLFL
jgi:hypothetical protein